MKISQILHCIACLTLLTSQGLPNPTMPIGGFPDSRYESLWTKPPFAVEPSATSTGPISPDYSLVGVVKVDDLIYASIQDKASGEIFVVASSKPSHGFSLLAVNRGRQAEDFYALLEKGAQRITLHLAPPNIPPNRSINNITDSLIDAPLKFRPPTIDTEPKFRPPTIDKRN